MNPIKRFAAKIRDTEEKLSTLSDRQDEVKNRLDESISTQRKALIKLDKDLRSITKSLERADASFTHLTLPETSQPKVLVAGFFGAFNLGDELMLETALGGLRDTHPSTRITIMLSDNYSCDITRYGDYDFIHYPNTPLEINSIARYFDAVIFPGGAIIDDVDYGLERRPLTLSTILVNLSLRFIAMEKPCILYGLSTNTELDNPEFIEKISTIAKKAHHFSLRDKNSLKTLSSAGIDTENIVIVDDIVIANELITKKVPSNDDIGLIFIYTDDLFDKIVTFTKTILEATPKRVKLKIILFYDYENNDLRFAQELVKSIGSSRISIESDRLGNFSETVEIIASKQTVFSMRYHGTLLANLLGRHTICINYSKHRHYFNKNHYLYSHYGFSKHMIDIDALDTVSKEELSDILSTDTKRIDTKSIQKSAYAQLTKVLKGVNLGL